MSIAKNVIHAIFKCRDCGEEWQDYLIAQQQAAKHAKAKKHLVSGELGVSVIYDGKRQ